MNGLDPQAYGLGALCALCTIVAISWTISSGAVALWLYVRGLLGRQLTRTPSTPSGLLRRARVRRLLVGSGSLAIFFVLGALVARRAESTPTTQYVLAPYGTTGIVTLTSGTGGVVAAPTSSIAGVDDTQTLTHKTVSAASNTLLIPSQASSARPAAGTAGALFLTDSSKRLEVDTGSAWQPLLPSVWTGKVTADTSIAAGAGTYTDLVSLTPTGTDFFVSAHASGASSGTMSGRLRVLVDGSAASHLTVYGTVTSGANAVVCVLNGVVSGLSSGSHTIKLQASYSGASWSINAASTTEHNAWLTIVPVTVQ